MSQTALYIFLCFFPLWLVDFLAGFVFYVVLRFVIAAQRVVSLKRVVFATVVSFSIPLLVRTQLFTPAPHCGDLTLSPIVFSPYSSDQLYDKLHTLPGVTYFGSIITVSVPDGMFIEVINAVGYALVFCTIPIIGIYIWKLPRNLLYRYFVVQYLWFILTLSRDLSWWHVFLYFSGHAG